MALLVWAKVWTWIKSKWQWVVGLFVGLITLLTFLIRGRQQKEVLDAANKAHEKENQINEKAKDNLVEGLSKISEEKDEKIKEVLAESDAREKDLEVEKEKLADEAAKSDDLGKKIANLIGAEYVESDDE